MLKKVLALLLLSIVMIFFLPYAQHLIHWLVMGHTWISDSLINIFSGGEAGNMIRGLIAVLCLPVLLGLIPSGIYWLIRRQHFPYFMEVVWFFWLLQAGAVLQQG